MRISLFAMTVALAAAAAVQSAHAGLVFSIEGPGVEATTVSGVTTENFDSLPTGLLGPYVSPIGTFSAGGTVASANLYGGAGPNGIGSNYYAVGGESQQSSSTLTLNGAQDYLGLWWSAGDATNILTFFDGASVIGTYHVGTIIPFLSPAYFGNPSDFGADSGEPFDYLNFTTTGSTVITAVQFSVTNLGSGFEMDNLSILNQQITPPGTVVPDAASTAGLLLGAVALLGLGRGYRRALGR